MTKINLFHNADDIETFSAGEVIFNAGDKGNCMYDVVEGKVDLEYQGRLLHTLEIGEIFGEMGILNNEPHSVTARARADCKVAKITRARFLFMVDQTPNFALHVMRVLAERLRKETRRNFEQA
jgi:CRP-like cAMP-binding protein